MCKNLLRGARKQKVGKRRERERERERDWKETNKGKQMERIGATKSLISS